MTNFIAIIIKLWLKLLICTYYRLPVFSTSFLFTVSTQWHSKQWIWNRSRYLRTGLLASLYYSDQLRHDLVLVATSVRAELI